MKLYEVEYRTSNYTDKVNTVRVVATTVLKAAAAISKRKYLNYSGYVQAVREVFSNIQIAK